MMWQVEQSHRLALGVGAAAERGGEMSQSFRVVRVPKLTILLPQDAAARSVGDTPPIAGCFRCCAKFIVLPFYL